MGAAKDYNVFWWKAEDTSAEVGATTTGYETGSPTYTSAKFNNGIDSCTNANYIVFSGCLKFITHELKNPSYKT